jgi:predicted nucleotidyltransferase
MDLTPFLKQLSQLCRENNVAMLGVFGSVARGDDTNKSDVDLLVKFKKPVSLIDLIKLEDKFVETLGRKIDLGTEDGLHPLIHKSVMSDLRVIYED